MEIPVTISKPDLWGNQEFQKNEWGYLNFLVGPNGTGKTLFAEALYNCCKANGLKARLLSAERLAGLEKRSYGSFGSSPLSQGFDIRNIDNYKSTATNFGISTDAIVILREKLDIKIKIEATLSELFGRSLRLAEEGGFLIPHVQKGTHTREYRFKEGECHGLKELVTLLTFLYDDEYNCLIIDEPELHLHPQLQTFFLQTIREIAGNPRTNAHKKCFFLITHSPYFVDIRTIEDLKHCIIFQPDKLPTWIDKLEKDDERNINRLLPRLNTHHKQFFFATRPIFVEGYTDQQLFALLQEKRGKLLGASGACIIDVGGKDELDLFFRLCKKLNIEAQFISDLDTLIQGKLRQSVSRDERSKKYLQHQGLSEDLMTTLGVVERSINDCLEQLKPKLTSLPTSNSNLSFFKSALIEANKKSDEKKMRYIFLLGLELIREHIASILPSEVDKCNLIEGKLMKINEAFKKCGIHVLQNGELENYLPSYNGNPFSIPNTAKSEVFNKERDFILNNDLTEAQICLRYTTLPSILDKASHSKTVNMDLYLSYVIHDWIHKVQTVFKRYKPENKEALTEIKDVKWSPHSRIFELLEFSTHSDTFTCKIKLKPLVDPKERELKFNNTTVPANYEL